MPRNYLKPMVWQSQASQCQKERENVFKEERRLIGLNEVSSEEHAQLHLQQRTKEGARQRPMERQDHQEKTEGFEKMSWSTYY